MLVTSLFPALHPVVRPGGLAAAWLRWLLLALLAGAWAAPASAQPVSIRPDPLLAPLAIRELKNDRAGFTWVAARQGLFRYDGTQLLPIARLVRQGPRPTGACNAVVVDATGQVWFGLNDDLYVFTPATGQLQAVPLPPAGGFIKFVDALFIHHGVLWIGQGRERLQILQLPLAARPYRPRLLPLPYAGTLHSFVHDSAGALLAQEGPIGWRLPPGSNRLVAIGPLPTEAHNQLSKADGTDIMFSPLHEVPAPGTRWLLRDTTLLETLPGGGRRVAGRWHHRYRSYYYPVLQLMELDSTWYWPGEGEVLALSLRRHPAQAGLRHLPVPLAKEWNMRLRFNRDTTGLVAFLDQAPGAAQLRPQPWAATPLPMAEKMQPSTRGVARLPDGRLLLGSYVGTFVQAADSPDAPLRRWRSLGESGVMASNLTLPDGRLLAANETGGFQLITAQSIRQVPWHFLHSEKAVIGYCVLRTRAGQLWGGGPDGLYSIDLARMQVSRYHELDSARWPLHQSEVNALAEAGPGELWLGTNRGLYWLRPATGELRHYGPQEPGLRRLPSANVNCLLLTHPDSLWVGTMDQGLLLLNPRRGLQQQLAAGQGLPSASVSLLNRPVPGGALWVGTYDGLVRYDPRTQRSTEYSVDNGLPSNEVNRWSAYYDAPTQQLYFGSMKGTSRISLPAAAHPLHQPRLLLLALTQHHAQGDTIRTEYLPNALPEGIHLQPGDAFADVQVGLTDEALPGRARFAYRLLGHGSDRWRPLGSQPWVRLLGLEPGDYTLEIKAETAEGMAASGLVRVRVQVRTYWWRRPGIWLLFALGLAAATGAGTRWWLRRQAARREAQRAAEAALRHRLAADLHDEVGGLLTRVTMRAELLEAQQATPQIAALVQESRSAAATMRDIIWSVDAAADTVEALLDRLRDLVETTRRATEQEIHLHLALDEAVLPAQLRPAVRQHAYLIGKEALTNALKHGTRRAGLMVTLHVNAAELLLEVENETRSGTLGRSGLGLRSMGVRAATIGAELVVGPQPGGRWQVSLRVPAPLAGQ
ncbi:MAG: histidine kinase [Janthinobacterium lividum]